MAKTKQKKQDIYKSYKDNLDNYQTIVLLDMSAIKTSAVEQFKNKLADQGSKYILVKNTIFSKALKEHDETLDVTLQGSTGAVFAPEEMGPSLKAIVEFISSNSTSSIKIGVIEHILYNKEKVMEISKLPAKPEMIAKTVGTIKYPLYSIVNTLTGIQRNFLYTLKAVEATK